MRPMGSTAVASLHSIPAPDSASEPRWTMCHSLAWPSCEEYWHIGDTTIRLERVTPRSVMGENRTLMGAFRNVRGRSAQHRGKQNLPEALDRDRAALGLCQKVGALQR